MVHPMMSQELASAFRIAGLSGRNAFSASKWLIWFRLKAAFSSSSFWPCHCNAQVIFKISFGRRGLCQYWWKLGLSNELWLIANIEFQSWRGAIFSYLVRIAINPGIIQEWAIGAAQGGSLNGRPFCQEARVRGSAEGKAKGQQEQGMVCDGKGRKLLSFYPSRE